MAGTDSRITAKTLDSTIRVRTQENTQAVFFVFVALKFKDQKQPMSQWVTYVHPPILFKNDKALSPKPGLEAEDVSSQGLVQQLGRVQAHTAYAGVGQLVPRIRLGRVCSLR